ncbi:MULTISPECIES: DUF1659 domain-containing protein [Bacillaceae]|uniref:DUF1659 domain-containing protein n=1 Tax=Pseudobacillus wudalianchiensis TaxID=1743143 RepID=A0A1B9ABW6_9BACI|nr:MULTISPECIES: DUF1659 domain-containing protein [Bacillus]KMY55221.1 hypothetical protein AC623_15875 [Bacillus sp. FJAT-27231]OCA81332.1 hypothetical protein A8F95_16375 [Bacillus wudalianchiensis]
MAQTILVKSTLSLVFDHGFNRDGKPLYKTKTFTNVDEKATADELETAGAAIAALTDTPLVTIARNDYFEIY